MLFLVDPEQHERVRERLKNLICVPVGFDTRGSTIVLYEPNGL